MSSTTWELSQTSSRFDLGRTAFFGAAAGAILSAAVVTALVQGPVFSLVRALTGAVAPVVLTGGHPTWTGLAESHWKSSPTEFPREAWAPIAIEVAPMPRAEKVVPRTRRVARFHPVQAVRQAEVVLSPNRQPAWVASFSEETEVLGRMYASLRGRFVRLAMGETLESLPSLAAPVRDESESRAVSIQAPASPMVSQARTPKRAPVERLRSNGLTVRTVAQSSKQVTSPEKSTVERQSPSADAVDTQTPSGESSNHSESGSNGEQLLHAGLLFDLSATPKPEAAVVASVAPLSEVTTQAVPEIFSRVSLAILKAREPIVAPVVVASVRAPSLTKGSGGASQTETSPSQVNALSEPTSTAEASSVVSSPEDQSNPWIVTEGFVPRREDVAIHSAQVWAGEGRNVSEIHSAWSLIKAPGYVDTLEYSSRVSAIENGGLAQGAKLSVLPMLSENSLKFLAARAGIELNPRLGTVVVRAKNDWKPQLSGVKHASLELSEDQSAFPRDLRIAGERTWVWFNVPPGFQIVRFVQVSGHRAFGSLPVSPSSLTWMDASTIQKASVSGTVYSASAVRAKGVRGAEVRIPGESVAVATTDGQGHFVLKDSYRVGEHPLDLEVWTQDDYPNRYRAFPDAKQQLTLFFFNALTVRTWTDQLQGGLSSAGGVLIGAAGDLPAIRSAQGEAVFPEVQALGPGAMIKPETYTLSVQDQLLVHRALDVHAPRYLGVQLPEGPVDVALTNQEGRVLRRELVISSPGVVNVLSPR